jgi:hypothetical protein
MAFSTRKAGIPFKTKLGTNADLSGQASNFTAYYINDADGTKTDIVAPFVEDANTAGLYMVETTIPTVGEYTVVIKNDTIGMGNHEHALVVTHASIDDVKDAIDNAQLDITSIKGTVEALDATEINNIAEQVTAVQSTVDNIKTLIDDEDGSAVNSVMEFVTQINDALTSGGSSLSALSQYTDNLELMLEGKAYTDRKSVV